MRIRHRALLVPIVVLAAACGTSHAPTGTPCPSDTPSAAPPPQASASAGSGAPPTTESETPTSFDVAAIDAWIATQLKKRDLIGLSVAIAHEGKIVLAKGYGKTSVEADVPVSSDTAFAIGSVTKQLTCASVLALADAGKLSLSDKVAKWFPDLTRANDITLDDVLSHVAGYPDYYPLDFVDARMAKATTASEVVREYGKRPLDFEPRTRFSYSNTGFLLAGVVVAKVSGESFASFVKKKVFEPLEMKHASLEAKTLTDVATGHTAFQMGDAEVATPEAAGWLEAAGAAYATAGDLARWDLGLIEHKVLTPKSYELMTTPRRLADGTPVPYACGLSVGQRSGETILQHNGAVSGFLAYNAMIPRTRSAVIVLSNAEHVDARSIHSEIVTLLAKAHDTRRPLTVAGDSPAQAARELFRQMQKGAIDRAKLGAEFNAFMTDAKVKAAAPRLDALGEPLSVDVEDVGERGGAQNASVRMKFKSRNVRAILHRTPDGKVQQFLLFKQ